MTKYSLKNTKREPCPTVFINYLETECQFMEFFYFRGIKELNENRISFIILPL